MPRRLSFQLYSARNFAPWDGVFAHLASCGYSAVEGYGALYDDPARTRDLLQKHNLEMPSGHFFPIGMFETERKQVLHIARTLGMRDIFCPYVPEDERPASAAAWKAWGRRLGVIAEWLRGEGFGFGWHNHDFEFRKLKDGSMPHERLFEGAPLLDWECDIAWVAFAGENPVKWIKAYGDRITAVHLKDNVKKGENLDQQGQADVGSGTIKWPGVFAALKSSRCRHYVVEHDNPRDVYSFAKRSFAFASKQ